MPTPSSLTFKQTIAHTIPAETLRMFLNPTALRDWLCSVALADLRPGNDYVPDPGKIEVRPNAMIYLRWESGFQATWQIKKYEPGKSLTFIWNGEGEPAPTTVKVSVKAKGNDSVLTVTHSGLGTGAKWAATRKGFQEGWDECLENLKSMLETGADLRITRRPRLGILYDEFNAAIAKKLGSPVNKGLLINGTAEGSGAHALGWQKDDVLVKFDGKAISNSASLGAAVHGHHAGDKVPVVWYRGQQKLTGQLQLGSFPNPEVPETPAALAQAVHQKYDEVNAILADLLKDLTDAQANAHPSGEWSVNELVAHFILMARDEQSWLADMLNDTPVGDFLVYRPNVLSRLQAVVQRFPTLPAILDELHRAQAETINMLESLSPTFVARKHLYRRFALWLLENMPIHYIDEHNEQFKTAIAAARAATPATQPELPA